MQLRDRIVKYYNLWSILGVLLGTIEVMPAYLVVILKFEVGCPSNLGSEKCVTLKIPRKKGTPLGIDFLGQ